jgi:hypothetical protein
MYSFVENSLTMRDELIRFYYPILSALIFTVHYVHFELNSRRGSSSMVDLP